MSGGALTHVCQYVFGVRREVDDLVEIELLRQVVEVQLVFLEEPPMRTHFGALGLDSAAVSGQIQAHGVAGPFHKSLSLVQLLSQPFDLTWSEKVLKARWLCTIEPSPQINNHRHPALHPLFGIYPAFGRGHFLRHLLGPSLRIGASNILQDLLLHFHQLPLALFLVLVDPFLHLMRPRLVEPFADHRLEKNLLFHGLGV